MDSSSAYGSNSGSSDESMVQYIQTTKRGRPRKLMALPPDPKKLVHLSEKERQYVTKRHLNNEASRRSRFNRRIKEQDLEEKARELERQHEWLRSMEDKLRREVERWKKGVIELTLMEWCVCHWSQTASCQWIFIIIVIQWSSRGMCVWLSLD